MRAVSKPFNFWDILIGLGVGLTLSLMILREFGPPPHGFWILDTAIWIPTIALIAYRTYGVRAANNEQEVEITNG